MHTCFSKYPELYKSPEEDEDDEEAEEEQPEEDEVQFDEEELKVINEEAEDKKPLKKKQEEPMPKVEQGKEKVKSKPIIVKPVKEKDRLIPTGGQPAMI